MVVVLVVVVGCANGCDGSDGIGSSSGRGTDVVMMVVVTGGRECTVACMNSWYSLGR